MATINGLTTLNVADVATGDFLAIYDADAGTDKKTPLYEVSTWTPALTFGGGSTGITYGSRAGAYVRIGTMIYVHGFIVLTSKGSSTGNASITGLPYSSGGTADSWLIINWSGMTSSYVNMSGYVATTSQTISIRGITAAATASTANVTDAGFANTSSLFFDGAYPDGGAGHPVRRNGGAGCAGGLAVGRQRVEGTGQQKARRVVAGCSCLLLSCYRPVQVGLRGVAWASVRVASLPVVIVVGRVDCDP